MGGYRASYAARRKTPEKHLGREHRRRWKCVAEVLEGKGVQNERKNERTRGAVILCRSQSQLDFSSSLFSAHRSRVCASRTGAGRSIRCTPSFLPSLPSLRLSQAIWSALRSCTIPLGGWYGRCSHQFLAVCYPLPLFVIFGQREPECRGTRVWAGSTVLLHQE